jgi:hypothetical protein
MAMWISTEKLFLDVSWFLLLCAILAFFRFHRWRKSRKSGLAGERESQGSKDSSAEDSRKRVA